MRSTILSVSPGPNGKAFIVTFELDRQEFPALTLVAIHGIVCVVFVNLQQRDLQVLTINAVLPDLQPDRFTTL